MSQHFLGLKDLRKIEKGQRRSWSPIQRPDTTKNQNLIFFFACLESFGNNWLEFNFDLNSKVKKSKKAAINGQSFKSKSHYFFCPNLVFPHY